MKDSIIVKNKIESDELIKVSPFRKEIRKTLPHKHGNYFEIIYLREGKGTHTIDYAQYPIETPTIFFVRREQVHHWNIESLPEGYVLLLKKGFLEKSVDNELKNLLSKLSSISCLYLHESDKIETFFQPSAYLSGDWYDYWKLNDKEVLFYLADVSGHGVTSSLLTSWMAAFHGRSKTPRELIKKLNGMLLQENIEKHITMVAGILNLHTHQIRWSSAGHYPPPIIFEPNQPPKILNTSSFPLGLTDDLDIEEFEFTLNRQTRFIICSDGALEPFDGGLNEQFAQLVDHLQKQSFQAPEHVADDIAILSLCRLN